MPTSTRTSGRHSTQPGPNRPSTPPHRRPRRRRRRRPALLLAPLLLVVVLVAVLALWRPSVKTLSVPKQPQLVRLDPTWTEQLAKQPDEKAMQGQIDQTIADIKALDMGVNALAWDGLAPDGAALYRDKTGTHPTSANLPRRFDAMKVLVQSAKKAGMTIYLEIAGTEPTEPERTLMEQYQLPAVARSETQEPGSPRWVTEAAPLFDTATDGGDWIALQMQQTDTTHGVMLGDWTTLQADPTEAVVYHAFAQGELYDPAQAWGDKAQAQTLAVTYPQHDHAKLTDKQVFLMGTSDPAQPLTVDGQPIERHGTRGGWGVLLPLEVGENVFQLQNGGESLTFTIEKPKPNPNWKPPVPQPDGSMGDEAIGKKVLITDAIASALEDPSKSGSIQSTLYKGAAAEILDVQEYQSGNKLTHAYQLSTGGWVRSATSTITDLPDAAFTGAKIYEDTASRSTVLEFTGSGTPAVYHSWEGDTLTIRLLSAQWNGTLPTSERFTANIQPEGKDLILTLQFNATDPLFGWAVNYTDGNTKLYFKHKPVLAQGAKPLTGLTVLLDPGHGDSDNGAVGSGGLNAPAEKDANLALALAARTRLEQLGATVTMTRDGDTFPSLGDRVTALNEQHPDLFISVHHNSIDLARDVNQVFGTEAYWFYDEGQRLAQLLIQNLTQPTSAVSGNGLHPRQNRGDHYGYYYVTRSNICPAVLLETGFMTNPAEYELCTDSDVIWAEAGGIAKAVYQFFRESAL